MGYVMIFTSKDFVSFVIYRSRLVIVIGLLTLLAVVVLNIAIIQDMNIRNRVMVYLTLIIIDFLFFICSIVGAKAVISLILSYDEDRVFASAREEMVAEQKSKMRRIAKIIRHITKKR